MMSATIEKVDCFRAARSYIDCVTLISQMLAQRVAHHWFVINNQDANIFVFGFSH